MGLLETSNRSDHRRRWWISLLLFYWMFFRFLCNYKQSLGKYVCWRFIWIFADKQVVWLLKDKTDFIGIYIEHKI